MTEKQLAKIYDDAFGRASMESNGRLGDAHLAGLRAVSNATLDATLIAP